MAKYSWPEKPSLLGTSVKRLDGPDKVTGRARYAHDVQLPGMLYARFLRSPHAHARVTELQTAAALKLPGVLAVLTPADVSRVTLGGRPVLARTATYPGEELAAVAAVSEELAEAALGLLRVRYEILTHAVSADEALRPGAPRLHPGGNFGPGGFDDPTPGHARRTERGDAQAALERADLSMTRVFMTQSFSGLEGAAAFMDIPLPVCVRPLTTISRDGNCP